MTQSFTDISSATTLQNSLIPLLNNTRTALSNSSGTAFPVADLEIGMFCYRTDLDKVYILDDLTPTWHLFPHSPAEILIALLTVDGAGSGLDADLLDGQEGSFYLEAGTYTAGDVLAKLLTVDGTGSNLDADKLDGQQGSFYLPADTYTAADILAKLLTVDGTTSGLDADLLDGQHGSYYLTGSNITQADSSTRGTVEMSDNAETQAGSSTSRAVTPASLASRTATTTRTGLVELATDAEVSADTGGSRAVTSDTVNNLFAKPVFSAATSGYYRDTTSRWTIQWGKVNNTSSSFTVTFPIAFAAAYNVSATPHSASDTGGLGSTPAVRSISVSSFSISHQSGIPGIYWIAIGKV